MEGFLDSVRYYVTRAAEQLDLGSRLDNVAPVHKAVACRQVEAFMYGAARCQAHVARNVINVEDDEDFVSHMVNAFTEMLRQNLADPNI